MALQRMEHTGAAPATGLASGINNSVTSFSILSGTGYPTGAVGPFILCLDPGTGSEEKVLCSGRTGTTVTVAGGGRGYDGTGAASHSSGTTNVQHVLGAIEVDDDNDHVYTTTRDDHGQYVRTDGTRAITGAQTLSAGATITTGGLTISAGGLTVSAGTSALQAITGTTVTGTGEVAGTDFSASGVTGAPTQARLIGSNGSGGAPSTGVHAEGDIAGDTVNSILWHCLLSGTPGTWHNVGGGVAYSVVYRNGAWTTNSSATVIAYDTAVADPLTMTNLSSGVCTVPVAGVYHVDACYRCTATAGTQNMTIQIFQNSSVVAAPVFLAASATTGCAVVSGLVVCAAGDTIAIRNSTSTSALTGATGQPNTYMHVRLT